MKSARLDAILRIIQDTIDTEIPPGEAIASLEALSRYARTQQIPLVKAMTRRLTPTTGRTTETENIPSLIIIAFDPTMNAAVRIEAIRKATKHSTSLSFTDHMKAVLTGNTPTGENEAFTIEDYLIRAFGDISVFSNMQIVMELLREVMVSPSWAENARHPHASSGPAEQPADTRPPGLFDNLAEGNSLTRGYSLSNIKRTIKKNGEVKIRFDATCFPNKNYNGKECILNVHSKDTELFNHIKEKPWNPPVLCITKVHGRPHATLDKPDIDTMSA